MASVRGRRSTFKRRDTGFVACAALSARSGADFVAGTALGGLLVVGACLAAICPALAVSGRAAAPSVRKQLTCR